MAILLLLLAGLGKDATAATITVNPGSSIQSGINSAAAGDTVLVRAGTYTGGITLNRSVHLQAEAGVVVNGNNSGQAVLVQCSDCSVTGFTFNDFAYGIGADNITGRNRVTLRNNIQRRTNYGFWVSGDDWTVENNEVDRIIRRSSGGDADYGRIFGNRHVIRRNWFHGTQIPTDLAPGPDYAHTDCFQYYNQNGEILRDVLIEENIFTDFVQGLFIGNETGNGSAVQRVTVRNNVFWGTSFQAAGNLLGRPSWGIYFGKNGPERNIVVENNIFRNCSNSLGILTGTDAIVRRNIVANGGSVYILEGTSPSIVTTTPGGNLLYQNNWVGEMSPSTDTTNVNPQFQNTNSLVGADGRPWTTDDGWRPMNTAAQAFGPQVTLGGGGGGGGTTVNAGNDTASVNEDAAATLINVLTNDSATPAATLTIASVGTPSAGGTATISGSSISYRPAANYFGTETFSYTARESGGANATATVTVTVVSVNDPPNAVNNSFSVNQDSAATSFNVLSNDTIAPDTNETLSVTSVTTPNQGGTASVVSNAIRYTPRAGFAGTETCSYTISDGRGGTDSATVTVTVSATTPPPPTNRAPDAVNNSYTVTEDSTGNTFNVLSNDTDPDGDTLTITSRTTPSQGGSVSGTSSLSYSPRANFSGTETFSYTISDGRGGSDSASVSVTVTPVNDPPNAVNDSYTVSRGSSGNTLAVLSNDTDPENNSLTITSLSATSNGGTVSIGGTSLSYTPAANYSGTDTFSYTISDGNGGSDTASVTVTVSGSNTRPTARDDGFTVSRNSSSNVLRVMTNDSDPDRNDEIHIAGFSPSNRGGVLSIGNNQTTMIYTPARNFVGTETFTYTIEDSGGLTDTATVTLVLVNRSPTAKPDRFRVRTNSTQNRFSVLSNDVSNSGTPLSLAGTVQEIRALLGTIELDGNDILYTPPADYIGEEAFLYTVRDENGDTATGEVTVDIAEDLGLNLCEDSPAILTQISSLYNDFGLTGSDVDGDTIPDDFMIEAMQIVACFDNESSLGIALQTAYEINLMRLDEEDNAMALAVYREALAALMLMNTGMQGALNQALDVEGLTLTGVYEVVSCDATGLCMPQPNPGQSVADGYQTWEEDDRGSLEEPFAGTSDIDDDGVTNAEEYAHVVEAGGSRSDFAAAVTDPELDGSAGGTPGEGGGGGGGGGCFIATAAYGTPLAMQIDVLRDVRDSQMLDTTLGAAFVDVYYRVSPPVARLVADHPALAAAVRIVLWPTVKLGNAALLAPFLVLMMALAAATSARLRRKRAAV